jgi:hypothetical protein
MYLFSVTFFSLLFFLKEGKYSYEITTLLIVTLLLKFIHYTYFHKTFTDITHL